MTLYLYKAMDERGTPISGEIEADSRQQAMEFLARQGHIPETVKEKSVRSEGGIFKGFQKLGQRIEIKELILYTKQFKTLLQAGVSILQIFQIMEAQTENKHLKSVTGEMIESVKEGKSLFKAFSTQKDIFPPLYCSMIQAGEKSGYLPQVLERLIYIIEHEEKVRKDIKSAVRYPLMVVMFLGVAFLVLLTYVVPKFIVIFENAGLALPLPTRICVIMHTVLIQYWPVMIIVLLAGGVGMAMFIKTDRGKLVKDLLLMKIPYYHK